jgi:penicillin-binding protein 2
MERSTARLKTLAILVALMFAALTTRLWFLQVLDSASATAQIRDQSVRIVHTDAVRGNILDDRGRPLVGNRVSLEVRVTKDQLSANAEEELLRLSEVLGIPVKDIRAGLDDKRYFDYQPKPVAFDVDENIADYLGEHNRDFPGVEVVQASVREYPQNTMAAHELGWVGQIDAQELEAPAFEHYGPNDLVGKSGLEQIYERYLRGKKGLEKYLVNSSSQVIRSLGSQDPTPGNNVVLSLDIDAQRIAERALVQGIERTRATYDGSQDPPGYLKGTSGAVIVMDPSTGAVKALASWPSFDPSWFVRGISAKQAAYLFTSASSPTVNRATQLTYAPGSTFKPFIALSAVQNGVANLGSYYPCPPEYVYPGDTTTVFHNWSTANLGSISIANALKISCDTVFYGFGADYYDRWKANQFADGALALQHDLRQFGFGKVTGLDLPSETTGLIPDPGWKETFAADNPELFNPGEEVWLPGDYIQMAIGQGYVTVTPMQLATAYAAIANGGKLCQPHLVDRIERPDGTLARRVSGHCGQHELPYTQAEIDYIKNALATVTQSGGTAGLAFSGFPLSTYPVAGKTGTAQRPPFQDTSWFAAIVPASDPQYVVVAMVEQGGHGSTSAAPIVRQVIEGLLGIQETGAVDGGVSD